MARVTITRRLILNAMQAAPVRAALAAKAQTLRGRVNSLGASEGVEMEAHQPGDTAFDSLYFVSKGRVEDKIPSPFGA